MLWVQISITARCTTVCDKVCQWLATGRWFSLGPLVSSTNKTDRHDITEILLKMALSTIKTKIQYILATASTVSAEMNIFPVDYYLNIRHPGVHLKQNKHSHGKGLPAPNCHSLAIWYLQRMLSNNVPQSSTITIFK